MRITDLTPPPGGVMTVEVGVVTGELTLRTDIEGTDAVVSVQYKGAEEWYSVVRVPLKDPADLDAIHDVAAAILNRPEG